MPHLRVHGKGSKIRYLPLHPGTAELIAEYVEATGQGSTPSAPLFRPVRNKCDRHALSRDHYGWRVSEGFSAHSLCATDEPWKVEDRGEEPAIAVL